jgi:EAL domain-containing protein (putative c-di-GMP-specific phosphodiesterase class I)
LIAQIGRWVLENACKQAAAWPSHITLAVNLSPVQFRRPSFLAVVTTALKESRLPPRRLELEISETALLGSSVEYLPVLKKLKELGVAIALDDFGTGHSSLSQLTMFPFDKIKIDKTFIGNMTERTDCGAIIDATLTMAKRLGMATTAEGVETTEQLRLLRTAGVTSMQGYLFAQPVPAGHVDLGAEYERLAQEQAD